VFSLSGTFFGLNTALRGLFAQQKAINTTAHNIANANTPGYTRQQVVMETTMPFPMPSLNKPGGAGQVGTGVDVSEIARIRDLFLDSQLRNEMGSLGRFEEQWEVLSKVETIFMEPLETGLSSILDMFWGAWEDLSNNAENSAIRTTLKELAKTVAETFNHLSSQLHTILDDVNSIVDIRVTEINTYAEQIANLNKQIAAIQLAGDQPNDLKDRRDILLDKLASLVDYSYTEKVDGTVTITLNSDSGDFVLVEGDTFKQLTFDVSSEKIIYDTTSILASNGELKGLEDARQMTTNYLDILNTFAYNLADGINTLHKTGFGLDGSTNIAFFKIDPSKDGAAAGIYLNSEIDEDVSKIAASSVDPTNAGEVGNGDKALEIYQLARKVFSSGDLAGTSLNNFYKNFIAELGVEANTALRNKENQQVLVDQLTTRKESTSGVSTDEEMVNLIQYQRAYEAAAKIISVYDEMLATIIHDLKR
jgi:flagellar hook-associated protein 1 FlgK